MMLSRRVLASLGGLERGADVLAEDFVLGKLLQHAGLPVTLAPTVLENVTTGTTIRAFVECQLRWAMIRSRLRPVAQLLEIVTSPLALLPPALASFGWQLAHAWTLALLALRALLLGMGTLGYLTRRNTRQLVASPYMDSAMAKVMASSFWYASRMPSRSEPDSRSSRRSSACCLVSARTCASTRSA